MAGGTGLYINAFCNGLDDISEVNLTIRNSIRQEYKEKGIEWLRTALESADPDFASSDDLSKSSTHDAGAGSDSIYRKVYQVISNEASEIT